MAPLCCDANFFCGVFLSILVRCINLAGDVWSVLGLDGAKESG